MRPSLDSDVLEYENMDDSINLVKVNSYHQFANYLLMHYVTYLHTLYLDIRIIGQEMADNDYVK